ncbi:MAG: phosphatase PAP2 family protein [Pseudonocardiaceae bacterium]
MGDTMVEAFGAYRPLLPDRARWLAVVVSVLAIIVVAACGMRYANTDQHMPGWLDLTLDGFIRSHLGRDQPIVRTLASLGDPAQAGVLVAAVAGAAAVTRRWSGVLLTVVGTITAMAITELVLKPLVGRLSFGHPSFPSGHTTVVATVTVATVILIGGARWPRSIAVRVGVGLTAVTVAVGVAISLVAEHVHYATDTVAGCCVAVATVLATALGFDFVALRLWR